MIYKIVLLIYSLPFLSASPSLGAGAATLLASIWGPFFAEVPVSCYAYAPPCTLTLQSSRACSSFITSVVCGADVVSRFGLSTSVDLRESLLALRARRVEGREGKGDLNMEWLREVMTNGGPNLFPGGRVMWLDTESGGENRGGAKIFEADNGIFDFIAILPGMYKSHMPQFYLKEVEKLTPT